jgi:hypothetical protein
MLAEEKTWPTSLSTSATGPEYEAGGAMVGGNIPSWGRPLPAEYDIAGGGDTSRLQLSWPTPIRPTVRAAQGRLSALSTFHSSIVCMSAQVV